MTRSSLIFATILSLTLAVPETRLRKCCPAGMVLVTSPEVNCTIPEKDTQEVYTVDSEVTDHWSKFPICEHWEDVNIVHLTNLNDAELLQAPGCVEILYTGSSNETALVAVNCRHHQDDRVEKHERPNTSPLQLLNIRRCCPRDKVFDVFTKSCVTNADSLENYSDIHEDLLSVLTKSTVDLFVVSKGSPACKSGALVTYEIAPEDIQMEKDSLWVTLLEDGSRERVPATIDNSCLELTTNSTTSRRLAFRVCRNADFCQKHSCVRKCCPERSVLSFFLGCINANETLAPSGFYNALSNLTNGTWSHTGNGLLTRRKCMDIYNLNGSEILGLTEEGYLQQAPNLVNKHDFYCLDVLPDESIQSLVCFPVAEVESRSTKDIVGSVLLSISCIFLLLTLLVYIYLPSLQNLHGKTLMCHSASLLVSYLCLTTIPWVTPATDAGVSGNVFCSLLGYTLLLSLMCAFCWLNVMCFDIWRTFGRLRGNCGGKNSRGKTFLLYSLYAWGTALFITLCSLACDKLFALPYNVTPHIGDRRCWFEKDTLSELLFFRVPIAIQLTSNVVFFILTSEHCSKVKAEIRRVADPSDPRSKRFHADKTKLIMNVKLFVVMGITWIAEILSSLMNTYTSYEWKEIVFYWSDVINCLQGMLIFMLFVMKPRVYHALKMRLGFGVQQKKSSSQGTSTSQDRNGVKKSSSNSTLTSSFAISSVP